MIVGISVIELYLPGVRSLKAKRGVIRSLTARLHQEFNVACGEVDYHDIWQSAAVGVAVVSTTAAHAKNVLDNVARWIEINRPDVTVVDYSVELITE